MPISHPLNLYRHDRQDRALITLSGELDMYTEASLRAALVDCLRDGVRAVDVDLTAVTFCDCSGLNAFLHASEEAEAAGVPLLLHHPCRMLFRLITLTGSAERLLAVPAPAPDLAPVLPIQRSTSARTAETSVRTSESSVRTAETSVRTSGGCGHARAAVEA